MFYGGNEKLWRSFSIRYLIPDLSAILYRESNEDLQLIKTLSIFAPTVSCPLTRIMVGAVRYVNISCDPNYEYHMMEYLAMEFNTRKYVACLIKPMSVIAPTVSYPLMRIVVGAVR